MSERDYSKEWRMIEDQIKKMEKDWERRRHEATPLDILMHRRAMKAMQSRATKRRKNSMEDFKGNATLAP